jgi:site-specific DNA-methyltransferase (adenine-specific)
MLDQTRRFQFDVAQRGDALELLQSLPGGSAAVTILDPQHRTTLDRQRYGNEGARQRERCALPQMTDTYIDRCGRETARVLQPSGYFLLWTDTLRLCEAHHLRLADVLPCVDLIAWNSGKQGQGYRSRRYGGYLVILQKKPLRARKTWSDRSIPDHWSEKIDRKIHPHIKPADLLTRLIGATTQAGDLVVDPAAGSFIVLPICQRLGRRFIGVDCVWTERGAPRDLLTARQMELPR